MSHYPLNADLIDLLKKEFPRLWNNHHNREDAMQTLWLIQMSTKLEDSIGAARNELAWLEKDLGLVDIKPTFQRPSNPPPSGIVMSNSYFDTLDQAAVHSTTMALAA